MIDSYVVKIQKLHHALKFMLKKHNNYNIGLKLCCINTKITT